MLDDGWGRRRGAKDRRHHAERRRIPAHHRDLRPELKRWPTTAAAAVVAPIRGNPPRHRLLAPAG
jgi:hypothetical protein